MKFFLFILSYSSFSSAVLLERTQAQVGEKMISLIDIKVFKKREKQDLIPDSLLLDSLYKQSMPTKFKRSWNNSLQLDSKNQINKKASGKEKLPQEKMALNYLIAREMIWQIQQNQKLKMKHPISDITKTLEQKQGKLSFSQFSSRLKKVGFNSWDNYKDFLTKEQTINFYLMNVLAPKITLSNREIESAFFKTYKRKLFSDYEYDFLLVSFEENKKEQVVRSLQNKDVSKDFETWTQSLGLSVKNSKLKSKEIGKHIKKELDKLSVSQVSPLLFIGSSYYLLQLKWKEALIDPKDRDKKLQVEKQLSQKKLLQELSSWIQNERNQFFIKVSSL